MTFPFPIRRRLGVEDVGDVAVVTFHDRKLLDEQSIQAIGEQLFSLVDEAGRTKIILSMINLEYVSASLLARFIQLRRKLQQKGGRLILCNMSHEIWDIFEITKLNKEFEIVATDLDALQAF